MIVPHKKALETGILAEFCRILTTVKKKYADYLIKLFFATLALFIVLNFTLLSAFFGKVFTVVRPVLFGVIFYMVLAVPYDFFYGKVFLKIKNGKMKKVLSLVLTVLLFVGAVALLGALTVPQCIESIKEITERFSGDNAWERLSQENAVFAFLAEWGKKAYGFISSKFADYVPMMLGFVKDAVEGVYNVFFGLFCGVLLLAGRDSVKRQFKNTVLLILPEQKCRFLFDFIKKAVVKFSKYLGGQVTEAFILGSACYLVMWLLKVPYPALIGFVIGVANLIPVVGAYAGGILCGVLVFAVSPVKCLVFIVAVFILQQIEAFTTYPIIVGKYVGLSGFWITTSILVWGGLFGFWGLFLGVPLTAVIQDFLRARSLRKNKNIV